MPAKALVIQADFASGGGWARLTPTVSAPQRTPGRSVMVVQSELIERILTEIESEHIAVTKLLDGLSAGQASNRWDDEWSAVHKKPGLWVCASSCL